MKNKHQASMPLKRKTNASIFIPHLGCPHECSFCDKNAITQQENSVGVNDVKMILDNHITTLSRRNMTAEIAFFGGTFTAIDWDYRTELLEVATDFIARHPDVFVGIRCSTRPDYINEKVLTQLKEYNVTAIELGAQSMDDDILLANNRGHTADDVRKSAKLIKSYGFELGLQMMTGLYKDTIEKSLYTCDEIIKLKPDTMRLYPTVVFAGTKLAEINHETFTEEETVELGAEIYKRFIGNDIRVIRIGLNPPPERYAAENILGNYSSKIGELIMSRYFYNQMFEFMKNSNSNKFKVFTDQRNISKIVGHKGENKRKLEQLGFTYKIKEKQGEELEIHAL